MRAYRKTTRHPYCVYLTAEEARELIVEAEIAQEHSDDVPALANLHSKLNAVYGAKEGTRA